MPRYVFADRRQWCAKSTGCGKPNERIIRHQLCCRPIKCIRCVSVAECCFAIRDGEDELIAGAASRVRDASSELCFLLRGRELAAGAGVKNPCETEIGIRPAGRLEVRGSGLEGKVSIVRHTGAEFRS